MIVCTVCETLNSPETRFCDNCGASLVGAKPIALGSPLLDAAMTAPQQLLDAPSLSVLLSAAPSIACPECGELNVSDCVYCEGCGCPLRSALALSNDGAVALESGLKLSAPDVADPSIAAGLPALMPDLEPVAQPFPGYQGRPTLPIAPPISISLMAEDDGTYFNLSGKELILIGRTDADNGIYPDVDLTAHGGELGGVSRRHTQIQVRGNGWFVEDLGSMNGTWLNSQRLTPGAAQPLKAGDQLRLGTLVLRCESV